jgi:charged multivesicular body protein 1
MGNQMSPQQLEEQIFNMKFASKMLNKEAKRSLKEHDKLKLKVKKAMQRGEPDVARVYAASAVDAKNSAIAVLKLAARLDSAAARMTTVARTAVVSKTMMQSVQAMGMAVKSMDSVAITRTMDRFEQLENQLGVATAPLSEKRDEVGPVAAGISDKQVEDMMNDLMGNSEKAKNEEADHLFDGVSEISTKEKPKVEEQEDEEPEEEEKEIQDRLAKLMAI